MAEEKNRKQEPERSPMLSSAISPTILDIAAILDRVGGDSSLLREITAIFLEEYPVLMDEVRKAVQNGDPVRLERAAHSLKGSVSNFGCTEATAAALALESMGRNQKLDEAPAALARLETEFAALAPALNAIVHG